MLTGVASVDDLKYGAAFVQGTYAILLSLALSEAFKQFVPDSDKDISWNRLPSLLGFLFLIIPFLHGMSRYFYSDYFHVASAPPHFAKNLLIDGIAFMLLAASFFVMSRSLSPKHWRRLYCAVFFLLLVDSIWIVIAISHGVPIQSWLMLNGALFVVMVAVMLFIRSSESIAAPIIFATVALCTTILSYIWTYSFYFSE